MKMGRFPFHCVGCQEKQTMYCRKPGLASPTHFSHKCSACGSVLFLKATLNQGKRDIHISTLKIAPSPTLVALINQKKIELEIQRAKAAETQPQAVTE